ncbi:hypothetical protein EV363DRAFT_1165774 [Boletus edulis]|nr:hypothetical protein EV363DRAFT_1165774 [Boletus edulis]
MQVEGGDDDGGRESNQHNEGEEEAEGVEDAASGKKKGGRYTKNPKGSIAAKPTTISFYPELWRKLLDLVKARMQLHVAVEDTFPTLETAVSGKCREVLTEVITHFETNHQQITN